MRRLTVEAFVFLAASSIAVAAAAAPDVKRAGAPPPVLNVVHHRLKRGAPASYQALEASIVSAYERAKVARFFWLTFQSTKDARDVLYLNLANTSEEFQSLVDSWQGVSTAHPELPRMQQRLAKLIETQTSTLTTRRDDIQYGRTDVDFSTMRALTLTTFHVKPGREGSFVEAVRRASGSHAPWALYEANAESTFVLLSPLKSRAEARPATAVPREVRALKGVFRDHETRLYALVPAMSRLPESLRTLTRAAPASSRAPTERPYRTNVRGALRARQQALTALTVAR